MTNQKPPVDLEPITATTCPHCGAPEHCRGAGHRELDRLRAQQ